MFRTLFLGIVTIVGLADAQSCCDPMKSVCTAGLPVCSDMMMPQVTIPASPSVQPTYFPLPVIETSVTSASMESTMTFGTCVLPAVDIAFVNTDYTVKYMMGRILNCCLKIPMTNMPIVYTQVTRPAIVAPLLTAGNWTAAVTPKLNIACMPTRSPTITPKVIERPSETGTMTPKIVERPSESSTMTPKIVERPSETGTMTPRVIQKPSESNTITPTMTIRVIQKPSESGTMTPRVIQKPSESNTITPTITSSTTPTMTIRVIQKPSESGTMTPRVMEKPSESGTMTPKMQEPTPAPADVIMPPERPSESATMTPKIQDSSDADVIMPPERPSESTTMTPRVIQEKPSESATMTPRVIQEKPSESTSITPTMTIRVIQKPSESGTMTPRVMEKPSESGTMSPRVMEKPSESGTMTPRVMEKPSESTSMTPTMTIRVVEKPSESGTMTIRVQEKPSESSTMTIKVVEKPSESSTMTSRVMEKPSESTSMTPTMTIKVVEKPSESSTMTIRVVEKPSESATSSVDGSADRPSESVIPRYIERPSQSNTMTPKIREPSPDVFIQPVDDSRVSQTPEQIVERPTKSPSSSKSQKIFTSFSRSAEPSRAAIRYPTPSISRTSTPSRTIRYVKPSSSAPPSRLPVPTKYVILSPIPVTRRPTPTSIRTQKPAVINSQLTINNGNVTYLRQPETLQYIQASLACAAGVPLEDIRILNITQRHNGTSSVVLYDKGAPGLSSNGSVACYRPKTTPAANVARRLQVVDESTVTVDYVIVDPPVEILEPAAFVEAMAGDTGLNAIIAESGGTVMDVEVPEEIVAYAAVAAAGEQPVQVTENKTPMYIGAALGAGGLCGLAAAALLVMKARKRSAGKPLTRHVEIVEMNPVVRIIGGSERQMFVPGQVRV